MRIWKRALALAVAVTGVLACLSCNDANAGWRAGVAHVDLVPPYAVALGGYGYGARRAWPHEWLHRPDSMMFRPHEGILDAIRVKAMHVEVGEGNARRQVLFIGMDVVAAPAELRDALARRLAPLGYDRDSIIVSGSHTHSGPGSLTTNPIWVLGAMDVFHKKFHDWWIEQSVEAVRLARASVEPIELFSGRFETSGLQRNRRAGDHVVDRTAHTLFARSLDGRWLGGLVNLAIHGISLSEKNMLLSADTPGSIERHSERLLVSFNHGIGLEHGPTVIFMNGSEGDVSPQGFGVDGMELMGTRFAEQLARHMQDEQGGPRTLEPGIDLKNFDVKLGRARIHAANCVGNLKWLRPFKLQMRSWFPESAPLTQVRLGGRRGVMMMTWPGEPTSELGIELRRVAEGNGARDSWVLGLSNGHLGYFTSPWDFELGGLEACLNFYGKRGGQKVVEAHVEELAQ